MLQYKRQSCFHDGIASRGLLLFEDGCDYKSLAGSGRASRKEAASFWTRKHLPATSHPYWISQEITRQGLVKNEGQGRKDVVLFPERAIEEALIYYIEVPKSTLAYSPTESKSRIKLFLLKWARPGIF